MAYFDGLTLVEHEEAIAGEVMQGDQGAGSASCNDVGLDYLTLDRESGTLSGGEAQRIRLATQIGSGLVGVVYVLDEPSIGLHQRDNRRLIATLKGLRDVGNTVLVVEHDEETIREADHVVDLGPRAGRARRRDRGSGAGEQAAQEQGVAHREIPERGGADPGAREARQAEAQSALCR